MAVSRTPVRAGARQPRNHHARMSRRRTFSRRDRLRAYLRGCLRSRTIWFAAGVTLLGLIETNLHYFASYLPEWAVGASYIGIGMAIWGLRHVTTRALDCPGAPIDPEHLA